MTNSKKHKWLSRNHPTPKKAEERLKNKRLLINQLASIQYHPEDQLKDYIVNLIETLDESKDKYHNVSWILDRLGPYLIEEYEKLLNRVIELK